MIAAVHEGKKAVGLVFATVQQAIEAHPLGTAQRRRFHVLSTLHDGNVYLLQLTIAATVLERRQQQGIGVQVDNLFDDGTHTIATVHDATRRDTLLHVRCLDVLQVGHTRHTRFTMQHREQRAVDRGKDDAATQGRTDDGTLGKTLGDGSGGRTLGDGSGGKTLGDGTLGKTLGDGGGGRHQHVTMEHGILSPRMTDSGYGIAVMAHQLEQLGITERNSIATVGRSRLTASARR